MRFVGPIVAVALACGALGQRTSVPVGVDVGVFVPTDGTVRDTFGDTWIRVGLTPLGFQRPDRWKFTLDVAYLRKTSFGNRATLVPVTAGFTRSFGENPEVQPYVAVRAGPYFGDVDSPALGIDTSRVGVDANASVGIAFSQRFYLEARYDYFSDFKGLDFGGFFLSAGVRLFNVRI